LKVASRLEVWGGLECSRIRVADQIRDQIIDTGHSARPGDLDLIASLGIKTLRYPVLWETVCKKPGEQDWHWHDIRLEQLRRSGILPVVGLLHHGSGPDHCNVLDPAFPQSLARHAGNVALRYPWIERFTPVNEPMTTARLCGLYGHWYPHGRDETTCFRVVVAECRAIAASMKEIRGIIPTAHLVQTEDIGRVFANPSLQYQADYENERRWLALDLLAGRVDRDHPLHQRLLDHGIDARHLAQLSDDPCPPDIIGIDQYLTSDRFLDDNLDHHPNEIPGGNGRHTYVDVAAARSSVPEGETGFLTRIRETWERYRLPLALTEVHNGCTREEQLRWLMDGWNAAMAAREEGIDLRAVSVWSLFGALDWNSLLTRREGFYEPGAFDIRFEPPRPTVIASAMRALVSSGGFDHPVLARSGWWKPDVRCASGHPLLLTGSQGLDNLLADCCIVRRLDFAEPTAQDMPDGATWAVIHADSGFRSETSGPRKARPMNLTCRYTEEKGDNWLVLEANHSFDPTQVIHAFLDLVIDGATGHFQITKASADRQYTLEALGGADCTNATTNVARGRIARSA
jgi:beta-glucosidase/6-phospho-beta-glucosidase/beta-galactosidase